MTLTPEHHNQLAACATILRGAMDILTGRITGDGVPAWCETRGWQDWLLALDDAALGRFETEGLRAVPGMPPSLGAFLEGIGSATALPSFPASAAEEAIHHAGARKRQQIAAFVAACAPLATQVRRVVDLGSGHGHLTRALADAWQARALGLEWNAQSVDSAARLTRNARVDFVEANLLQATPQLSEGDVVVGLHACGALGDVLVEAARHHRVHAALVACCPQKRLS